MTYMMQRPYRRTTQNKVKSRKAHHVSDFRGTHHFRGQLKFGRQPKSYLRMCSLTGDGCSIVYQVCSRPRSSNGRFRKSTAFDRNLITFMKPGGGPLTLIVAYQHSPFSKRVVSVKMHHCSAPRSSRPRSFSTESLGSLQALFLTPGRSMAKCYSVRVYIKRP